MVYGMSGKKLKILAIEPYYGGSHRYFLQGLERHSRHQLTILSLPARYWKWRMHGGAVTLAEEALALDEEFDLIFATEMLNLPNFLALTRRRFGGTPTVLYFHENQATYPMPSFEKRDLTYACINWASLMAADAAWFNSQYHLEEFFQELPRLLKHFPDFQNLTSVAPAREKSAVVEPGLGLAAYDSYQVEKGKVPRVIWNHRWEYDKDPEAFFRALDRVKQAGAVFELVLAGQNQRREPEEFLAARERFAGEIVHYGFAPDFGAYARLLWSSHIMVSTARHEFFGMSAVEAMHCGCHPLLPNRLNYPSLVPAEFLYGTQQELVERLATLLSEQGWLRGDGVRRRVASYDWSVRAPQFDEAFEQVAMDTGRTGGPA